MLWLAGNALTLAGEAQRVAELLDFPPSLVAAALLAVARQELGNIPFWPSSLAILTHHQVCARPYVNWVSLARALFGTRNDAKICNVSK